MFLKPIPTSTQSFELQSSLPQSTHKLYSQNNKNSSLMSRNSIENTKLSTFNPKTSTTAIPIMICQMLSHKPSSKPTLLTRSLWPSLPFHPHCPSISFSTIQMCKVTITIVKFAMTEQCSCGIFAIVADISQRICVWFCDVVVGDAASAFLLVGGRGVWVEG
jgi:hypothetical protein